MSIVELYFPPPRYTVREEHSFSLLFTARTTNFFALERSSCNHVIAKRRRCVALTNVSALQAQCRYRGPRVSRPIFSFTSYIQGLSDSMFTKVYRMNRPSFFKLADMLTVTRSRSGMVFSKTSPLLRLSMTLRWLAGGSYLDIYLAHGVQSSSFYFHLKQTLIEIDNNLEISFLYRDENWLEEASTGFTRDGRSPLSGCCAAVDALAIKITEPSRKEVGNTSTYYNRKGFFAINLQAACDHKYRFIFVSGLAAGSTHDSTAFAISSLARLLHRLEGGLLSGYWVACDDAHAASRNMVTPWPGRRLSTEKDCFNYWLSFARIHIEQAFGILVARWGVLWRPLRLKVRSSAHLLVVLCKLHNYIMEQSGSALDIPPPSGMDASYHIVPADYRVILQDECDIDERLHRRRRDLETCDIRATFTSEIKDAGLKRPMVY